MSAIAAELNQALSQLDVRSAAALELLVRDAIAIVRSPAGTPAANGSSRGWPAGYFEKYAGSLADDDWQPPLDPPPSSAPEP